LAAISTLGNAVVDVLDFDEKQKSDSPFEANGWTHAVPVDFGPEIVLQIAQQKETHTTTINGRRYMTHFVGDIEVGWEIGVTYAEGLYFDEKQYTPRQVKEALVRAIWEFYGPNVVLGQKDTEWQSYTTIQPDPIQGGLPTQRAKDLAVYFRVYRNRGHHRAVLLYGEPGTGKSTTARSTLQALGGLTARLHASKMDCKLIRNALDVLQPSGVIIDDLDRAPNPNKLIEVWESLKTACPVFIVTANDLGAFDSAMLRPGRFDKIVHLDRLEPEALASVLESVPASIRDHVADLPIAYISEIALRAEVEGEEEALAAVQELEATRKQIIGRHDD